MYRALQKGSVLGLSSIKCLECSTRLNVCKACNRGIFLRCPNCNAEFTADKFKNEIDEAFEEIVSRYPCDRI